MLASIKDFRMNVNNRYAGLVRWRQNETVGTVDDPKMVGSVLHMSEHSDKMDEFCVFCPRKYNRRKYV